MRYSISSIKQGFITLKAKWSEQNHREQAIPLRLLSTDRCISLSYRHIHRLQDGLRISGVSSGDLAARGLQGKDLETLEVY